MHLCLTLHLPSLWVFFFFFLTSPLTLFNQQTTYEMKISHSGSSISTLGSWALNALYCDLYSVIFILYFLKESHAACAVCLLFFLTSYS